MNSRRFALSDLGFFGLVLALLVLSAGGHLVVGDEETMFRVTQNLATGDGLAVGLERLTVPPQPPALFQPDKAQDLPTTSAVPGRNSLLYSKYGIGQSLLALPFYAAGGFLSRLSRSQSAAEGARLAVSMFNAVALAACAWLLLRFGIALGLRVSSARWVAVAVVFTTMAWPYVKTFYPQPAVAFFLLATVYAGYRWCRDPDPAPKWLWVLALACAATLLLRLSSLIVLPALMLYLGLAPAADRRVKGIVALVVGAGAGMGLTAVYNVLRFGSPLTTGYHEVAWTNPVPLGLYGLLFSPGKGVFLYAPLLLLALGGWLVFHGRHRAEAWLMVGLWASYLAFYAPYNFWTGGFNWGPRFLLPLIPLSFLTLGTLLELGKSRFVWPLFFLLFGIGIAIQTPAVLVDHSRYLYQQVGATNPAEAYTITLYQTDESPIVHQWPVAIELLQAYRNPQTWRTAAASLEALSTTPAAAGIRNGHLLLQAEFLRRNTIDFWWLHHRLLDPEGARLPVAALAWVALGLASALLVWYDDKSSQ